jgi:hypothetical protein
MIRRDRELLARLSVINQNLGEALLRMFSRQYGGELRADDLRRVGAQLADIGNDMVRRADELDGGGTADSPAVVPSVVD